MSVYQKAFLCPYKNGRPLMDDKMYVQFNPAEISIDEAVGADDTDGDVGGDLLRFLKGGPAARQQPVGSSTAKKRQDELTLSTTLFFNTMESLRQTSFKDVREYMRKLYRYRNNMVNNMGEIEKIYFGWGSLAVAGMLTRLSVSYTMFAPDGRPVRAKADISIRGDYFGEQMPISLPPPSVGRYAGLSEIEPAVWVVVEPSNWRNLMAFAGNPRL